MDVRGEGVVDLRAEWAMTLVVDVAPGSRLGSTPGGTTTVIPIVGGTVDGPQWCGRVLPGGFDWNTEGNGLTTFLARYNFVTDDGVLVSVTNEGTTLSDFRASLVKTRTTFLVDGTSALFSLLYGVHVGTVDVGEIAQGRVRIGVYRLL
jgi:hypothetical protein